MGTPAAPPGRPPAVTLRRRWLAALLLCILSAHVQAASSAQQLVAGRALAREALPDAPQTFVCELAAGAYAEVVVTHTDADPTFIVISPGGERVLEVEPVYQYAGSERVAFIAAAAGLYRVTIEVAVQQRGHYSIELLPPRAPQAADLARVQALQLFAEARALRRTAQAPALRRAVELLTQSLPLWRDGHDELMEAETLGQLGLTFMRYLGEPNRAVELRMQELALRRRLGHVFGEATALAALGFARFNSGELEAARELYEQALPLIRRAGGPGDEAALLGGFAQVFQQLGRLDEALEASQAAADVMRRLGDPRHEALALEGLANTWRAAGDLERARDLALRALELRAGLDDPLGRANLLTNLGIVLRELGDDARAEQRLQEAERLCAQIGQPRARTRVLGSLAALRFERGDAQGALELLESALALAEASGRRDHQARWLASKGEALAALGQEHAAESALQAALPLARSLAAPELEAYVLATLARVAQGRGDLAGASELLEQALALGESLRSALQEPDLRAFFLGSVQERYAQQVDVLMARHAREPGAGYDARALQVSERARARGLLDVLAEARVDLRTGIDPALHAREQQLRQRFAALAARHTRLAGQTGDEPRAAALAAELEALHRQLLEAERDLRRQSPQAAALKRPEPLDATALAALLDEQTVLLEYAFGQRASYVWALTRSGLWSAQLRPRAEIEDAALAVHARLLARQPREGDSAAERQARLGRAEGELHERLARLAEMLLGPLAGRLAGEWRGKRLAVVASGALELLPFGLLPIGETESGPARALLHEHEVVSLPSASTLALLRAGARPQATKAVAVLADPVFSADDPRVRQAAGGARPRAADSARKVSRAQRGLSAGELRRLPFSRLEAQAIDRLTPRAARLTATDFEASRATATSPELAAYRILHFATHGVVDEARPELSGLVLSLVDAQGRAQDGFLGLHEVYNLRLGAELVVLSACRTALGRQMRGEGLVSLARGFMYAGARQVLASLWKVDDLATAELMQRFYRGLFEHGLRPAAALRAAQLELARSPRWSAPYYWAGFVLQGDWR